ncbi:response regulator transcription factor [Candidatus Saccharibacteria bacterium]|nr:response regulator transcription factor [Candidatus Saccharibacteria bacterium]
MSEQPTKIAIVEDDLAIVEMYRAKFEHEGYAVQTAGDGQSGLELFDTFKPDIVLLDLMMPEVTGFDVLSHLRQTSTSHPFKVIVLTNMGDTETATRVYKMAADDFIVKAESTPKEVVERVQTLLGKKSPNAA